MPTALTHPGSPVLLRHPTPADQAEYVALRRVSRAHLEPWEPRTVGQWTAKGFERVLHSCNTDRTQRFLIYEAHRDGNAPTPIVGQININEIVRGAFHSAYLGYWIGAPYINRGYMTAALRLALHHAFHTLKLHRVEANVQPHNTPSLAAIKKLGFRLEGLSPLYLKINDTWSDHERWALTLEDYAAKPALAIHPTKTNRRSNTTRSPRRNPR